ncbi:MAG: hypothetical protein ACRDT4_01035 [Micromonosporaceae bacterium]
MTTPEEQYQDVVGERVILGIQMIGISRLSTHPVPLVPGCLITVAGQGPTDSNGAGKSSFIAGLTLLHGDEQWRLASGARESADLLFSAEAAGQERDYASAEHGYLIGVFGYPSITGIDELAATAVTVWLRINRERPHVLVRWADGLHLPTASTEADREIQADQMWQGLPPRAGRKDFIGRDLSRVLFGEHIRCVSFLSTSVRPTNTANLLAQPLNELKPDRIFSAVAALTGLDHELQQEQQARSAEHAEKEEADRAEINLCKWEEEAYVLEQAIDRRDEARALTTDVRDLWRNRAACLVAQAQQDLQDVNADLEELRARQAENATALEECNRQVGLLGDGAKLQTHYQQASQVYDELQKQDEQLRSRRAILETEVERLGREIAEHENCAREADGRDEPSARDELAKAEAAKLRAIRTHAIADKVHNDAADALAAAESGTGVADEQLRALGNTVRAVALLDAVSLTEADRPVWEPLLWPYREAVVVHRTDMPKAITALAGKAGSMLVPAEDGSEPALAGVPRSAEPDLDISRFLAALRSHSVHRDDPARAAHHDTGVVTIGGFDHPVSGRAARIFRARATLAEAGKQLADAEQGLGKAERAVGLANRRLTGAQAAGAAAEKRTTREQKRRELRNTDEARGRLGPRLSAARAEYDKARTDRELRQEKLKTVQASRNNIERTRQELLEQGRKLLARKAGINLDQLLEAWGGTVRSAEDRISDLSDDEQLYTEDDWWRTAEEHLARILNLCFPEHIRDDAMPAEVRELLTERAVPGRGQAERQKDTLPRLLQAVENYLRLQADYDTHKRAQLATQRTSRRGALEAAQIGHAEAAKAAAAVRASLAKAVKARLDAVSQAFDELDQSYGGYGAGLRYAEPEPPTDPTKKWNWEITPVWRRAEGKALSPYDRRGNTAQMDEKAVKLVCAAALASGTGHPLLLVLDELGRNLGKQHRREAVALFERIGRDNGITVVGALQDDMERYAIDACGQYIKLRRSSDAMPYNQPPAITGYDDNEARVLLLGEWLTGSHQDAEEPDTDEAA